ncbi:RNase P subunit p30-domain-containing protein [Diplogelasinospora grovesii]|uniref:RNase P subunit p30-domain-containing protein n=1 Tax=Diplogelasinospora grovesii TaxID=303347 RepID=A0AAN6MXM1_9PEZI|nr:RNase P subunit p30-domain-containing protein [Diplogelasinospora grovesii]
MLYDLNLAWSPGTSPAEVEKTLRFAKTLGYDVVALNHTVTADKIPNNPQPIPNPIPQLTPPPSSYPSYPAGSSGPATNLSIKTTTASKNIGDTRLPTCLRRATVMVTDPTTTNYRLPDIARSYDMLAVRPTTDKAFSWACLSTTDPPALISLDLTAYMNYHIHHRTAMAAVNRGTRFEICYSQAIGAPGPDAQRLRANFIANVLGLIRATKGRGIIVSSEARSALGLRGPADVVNLMAIWGLGPEKGMEALSNGARAVVVNEGIKRRSFRGVVDIVKPAPPPPGGIPGEAEREENMKNKQNQNKQKGNRQQANQQQGQKRKNEQDAAGGGGQGEGGQMSKRQAKRMKKEGLQGGSAAAG